MQGPPLPRLPGADGDAGANAELARGGYVHRHVRADKSARGDADTYDRGCQRAGGGGKDPLLAQDVLAEQRHFPSAIRIAQPGVEVQDAVLVDGVEAVE